MFSLVSDPVGNGVDRFAFTAWRFPRERSLMWTTDQVGLACWLVEDTTWHFDVRGGEHGIGMLASPSVPHDCRVVDQHFLSILPVDGKPLPLASEQFIRGDRVSINYPQGDGNYAIRMSLEPIESSPETLVLEATISIQTDLLDSHPMLDLVAEGNEVRSVDLPEPQPNWRSSVISLTSGAPAISLLRGDTTSLAVILDPHDSPATSDRSGGHLLCLRLFGDFLEKGVIRTARPWIVVDRSGAADLEDRLRHWHQQLCKRPLPLSS